MFLLSLTALFACGEPEPPADPCAAGPAPELTVGTGEYDYQAMGDGALELIHGPQGGYHVLIGLEARYMDPSQQSSAELLGWIDGVQIGDAYPWINWRCNAATGTQQTWNLFLIWDAEPEDLRDQTAEVEATVTDAAGQTASAWATITIIDQE